jgi:Zn-dependent M32 family carboxypeptidase
MTDTHAKLYEQLCRHSRETAMLAAAESTLGWDERTMMPPEAAEYRAEQMTLLAGMIHQRRTDPRILIATAAPRFANSSANTTSASNFHNRWSKS